MAEIPSLQYRPGRPLAGSVVAFPGRSLARLPIRTSKGIRSRPHTGGRSLLSFYARAVPGGNQKLTPILPDLKNIGAGIHIGRNGEKDEAMNNVSLTLLRLGPDTVRDFATLLVTPPHDWCWCVGWETLIGKDGKIDARRTTGAYARHSGMPGLTMDEFSTWRIGQLPGAKSVRGRHGQSCVRPLTSNRSTRFTRLCVLVSPEAIAVRALCIKRWRWR